MSEVLSKVKNSNLYYKLFKGTPWRGVYPSFAAAQAAIPRELSLGYNSKPAAYSARHHPIYRQRTTDYVTLFHLPPLMTPGTRLVDFGGSVGMFYYIYQRYLTLPRNCEWLLCDLPEIIGAARELAATKRDSGCLRFTSDFKDAEGCRVLLTAGALQYIETPLASLLGSLRQRPAYLLINRIPAWDRPPLYTIQNIGGFSCAYQIFHTQSLLDSLRSLGYEVVDQWECPESTMSVRFRPGLRLHRYMGFYLAQPDAPLPTVKRDFDPAI